MINRVDFFSRSATDCAELGFGENSVLFHGEPVDERGELAIAFGNSSILRLLTRYSVDEMEIRIQDDVTGADNCSELFDRSIGSKSVILEATTLGFAELFTAIRALISLGKKRIEVIYVEPEDYSREKIGADQFALSDVITGYRPIPHSIVDLNSDDLEAGVFFLGFESERLDRAMEEHQMIVSKEIKVVFGVPAFQPGWELNSIVPHLPRLLDQSQLDIAYCAANDPEAAYESLELTRKSLGDGKIMFVAPIGTKPCGIASAVFASIYPKQVGLLFDHPKKKNKRSDGASVWHRYSIVIGEDAPSYTG